MFLLWTVVVGVVGFVAGVAVAAWAVLLLPADYFLPPSETREAARRAEHPVRLVSRNLLGAVLVVLGVIMLVAPGQGLLTIVIGLMLLDFPGKHALVRRLVARPHVLAAANKLRARFGKAPLEAP
jgi:hypothetical protein